MPATAPLAPPPTRAADAPPAVVTLYTVGECRITVARADEPAEATTTLTPASDRLFTLTLLLATSPGRPLPRTRVADWLWPDLPPAAARHALRQLVYRLRQLGVAVDGDDAHLTLASDHVGHAVTLGDGRLPHAGRCLSGWEPRGHALRAWVDRYRATVDARTRDTLARALEQARADDTRADDAQGGGTPRTTTGNAVALAATLLELDPEHPLARATIPRATVVRETPRPAHTLPCIGRDHVLEFLRTRAVAARAGHGSTVTLAARPGVGATRVLDELAAAARTLGLTTATGAARPPHPTPVAPALATIVRTLLDRPGALGCAPETLRALRRFVAAPTLPIGDAPIRRLGIAIAELARAIATEHPLVLAVDARCTSPAERALTAAITHALHGAAVLAVFLDALPARTASVVALPALSDADAGRLAAAAARARNATLARDDVAWCVSMARGRPGEVIALATNCVTRPGARDLPASIGARLREHVAALPLRTRQVAALRALLGDRATTDLMAHTLNRRPVAVEAALEHLRRADLPGKLATAAADTADYDATRVVGTMILATFDVDDRTALCARAAAVCNGGLTRAD